MQLTRLQELLATQTAETLTEGKQHDKDFDGIRNVVDDCLADLKDKLGKGGNLATLMKDSGASKMDTEKDASGKNVLNQIMHLTSEYTKAISKLMTEAEMLVAQVNEEFDPETGEMLNEASSATYEDSSEFTDEFYGMMQKIAEFKGKMKNPRWMAWMKVTDSNFGTETEPPARSAISAINNLHAQFQDIDTELDKAN